MNVHKSANYGEWVSSVWERDQFMEYANLVEVNPIIPIEVLDRQKVENVRCQIEAMQSDIRRYS
jgi:hypothetical protein